MTINVLSSAQRKSLSALFRGLQSRYADQALKQLEELGYSKMPFPVPSATVDADAQAFMADYLAYSLLRKSRVSYFGMEPPCEEQLIEETVSSFLEVEKRCEFFNRVGYIPGTAPTSNMLAPEVVFQTARRKIARLLGDFDLNEFVTWIDFSNGASTRLAKRDAAIPVKFTGKPHVTRGCSLLAVSLMVPRTLAVVLPRTVRARKRPVQVDHSSGRERVFHSPQDRYHTTWCG